MLKIAVGLAFLLIPGPASAAYVSCYVTGGADALIANCSQLLAKAQSDADRSVYLVTRASAYLQNKDGDHALADLDEAIRLDPSSDRAFHDRASFYRFSRHDNDRAIADESRAIALQPNNYAYLSSRADLFDESGKFEQATADYDAALKQNPANTVMLLERGDVWRHRGNYAKAIADFEASLKTDPTFTNASNALSEAHAMVGLGPILGGGAPDRFQRASVEKIGSSDVEFWTLDGKPDHCALITSYGEPASAFARSAKGYALTLASSKWTLGGQNSYPVTIVATPGSDAMPATAKEIDPITVGILLGNDPSLAAALENTRKLEIRAASSIIPADLRYGDVAALGKCWEKAGTAVANNPFASAPVSAAAPAPASGGGWFKGRSGGTPTGAGAPPK